MAIGLVGCSSPSSGDLARDANRNVLVITVDTLRAGVAGFEGGAVPTPNMARLAAEGIRFSFAHAHAVVTLPSHASILTGAYPFAHGYRENGGYRLAPGTDTLAERLRAAGFATGAFVGAFPLDARFGLSAGFDVYDGRFDDSGTGAAFVIPERPAATVVARARSWIAAQRGRWFAWVHLYDPHAPYRPPPPFDGEYARNPYLGEVAAVDAALGPLLDDARSSARPTLVVLTADHGESLGDHGEQTHGLFAYESTLRVPMVVADAGGARGAARPIGVVSALVRHVDIVPTILDALKMDVPKKLPGQSLVSSRDRDAGSERASYFEAMSGAVDYGWAPLTGVLVDRRKFIRLPIPELYDLSNDADEKTNRAATDAATTRTLESRLVQFKSTPPAPPRAEAAAVAERLRSLGYVAADTRWADGKHTTDADDPKRLVDLDRQMHEAAVLDSEGRLDRAAALYRAVLARRPDMVAAARHLAFDEWRSGRQQAAIGTLQEALRAAASPGAMIQLGAYLMESGRADQAIAVLEQAVALEPGFDALNALGLAYARAGRESGARGAFDRALAIDPASPVVHENLGAVHLDAGRLADARRAFELALAADPDSAQAHHGLALAAARAGDATTAIEHWGRVLALDPSNIEAVYDLGVTLAKAGQHAQARRYLERFVRTAPRDQFANEIANARALMEGAGRPD